MLMKVNNDDVLDFAPVAVCLLAVEHRCSCGARYHSYDGVVIEYAPTQKRATQLRIYKRLRESSLAALQDLPRRTLEVHAKINACGSCWTAHSNDMQLSFFNTLFPPKMRPVSVPKKNYLTIDEL